MKFSIDLLVLQIVLSCKFRKNIGLSYYSDNKKTNTNYFSYKMFLFA